MRRFLATLVLLCLPFSCGSIIFHGPPVAAAPAGAIVYDTRTEGHGTDPIANISHAQGSLTNGGLVVAICTKAATNDITVSAITYEGADISANQVVAITRTNSGSPNTYYRARLYFVALGTSGAGTKTLAVTLSNTAARYEVLVVTFSGVKQSFTPASSGNTGVSTTPSSGSVSTGATDLVIAAACSASATITEGQTLYNEYEVASPFTSSIEHTAGTGSPVAATWTIGSSTSWAAVAMALQAN